VLLTLGLAGLEVLLLQEADCPGILPAVTLAPAGQQQHTPYTYDALRLRSRISQQLGQAQAVLLIVVDVKTSLRQKIVVVLSRTAVFSFNKELTALPQQLHVRTQRGMARSNNNY
jgi:hypothetical protein